MLRMSYYGNPFLGLFFKANNSIALAPINLPEKNMLELTNTLGVKIIPISFGSSNLAGLYVAMNNNGIIVPNIIEENELVILKKEGFNILVSAELNNAHGNNICVNDNGGIINPHVNSVEKKKIQDTLGVELVSLSVARYTTVGSVCIATNKGFLTHYSTSEKEMKSIESALGVRGDKGTMNNGVGFMGISTIVNERNFIIGEASSGFEIGKIESALRYI